MSEHSNIEWTDATWPVVAGCGDESPGCLNCFAKRDSHRLAGNPNPKVSEVYSGTTERRAGGPIRWTGLIRPLPERLGWPLKWRKPRRVFVCNESDLFHPDVPDEFIHRVFCVMAIANWHTYQILTKRAERAASLLSTFGFGYGPAKHPSFQVPGHIWSELRPKVAFVSGIYRWPLPNVWLGVSVEDQKRADERIPHLLRTPAVMRFLSCEPLLESVDLRRWVHPRCPKCNRGPHPDYYHDPDFCDGVGAQYLPPIDWVIVGGESGPNARPMHPDWARSLRDQCQAAEVAYFFKQWGGWSAVAHPHDADEVVRACLDYPNGRWLEPDGGDEHRTWDAVRMVRVGKKAAGRLLDGRTWDEFPTIQSAAAGRLF